MSNNMDHQLGDTSTGVDVIQKPWKNQFWREYQRHQELYDKLTELEAEFNVFLTDWQEQNATVLSVSGLSSIRTQLVNINATLVATNNLLQTIADRLIATNSEDVTRSVAGWCSSINSNTRDSTGATLIQINKNNLPGIKTQLDKLTFTGPDLNVL